MEKSPAAFRTISEVAQDLNLPQHVLRFWEQKFTQVRPLKRGGGRRYYRPQDVDLLQKIQTLLYVHGYTIKGVQKILKSRDALTAALARGQEGAMMLLEGGDTDEAGAGPAMAEGGGSPGAAVAATPIPACEETGRPLTGRARLTLALDRLRQLREALAATPAAAPAGHAAGVGAAGSAGARAAGIIVTGAGQPAAAPAHPAAVRSATEDDTRASARGRSRQGHAAALKVSVAAK